jgi:hypothetical protein
MAEDTSPATGRFPRWLKWPALLLAMLTVGTLIWQQLPGAGYSTDLSKVGAGLPTLVLTRDNNYVGGAEVMELMNDIRADYAGRVDFLVAHLPTPAGRAFVTQHGVRDGTVVLFDAEGRRVDTLPFPGSTEELRSALDRAFGR